MTAKRDSTPPKKTGAKKSPKTTVKIKVGNISGVRGEMNIAARDIIKNVQTIYERALTPGETVEKDLRIETNKLAEGIRAYLDGLKQQVLNPSASVPYKGLDAYTLSDAEAFFGRDQAIRDLRQAMKRGRLTILQAESGAGKTSLLQAGILPRLIVEKQLAVLIRPQFENPAQTIKKCFVGNLELTPKLANTPLVDFLRRTKKIIGGSTTLYLLLDQFEEFFSKHTLEEDRQAFIRELAQCLNDTTLNVRWVISITSDAFWQLGKLEPHVPNPFSNVQSLYLLDRTSAVEVIAKPAKLQGLRIQSGLIERVLSDLSQQQKELIAPTQIQLVCVALYDDFQGKDRTFTLAQYEQKGCAEGILSGYIGNVLSRYLPVEERTPAYKILEELITSEKKRVLRGKTDLETALGSRGISAEIVESALNHLVNRRLLRRLGDGSEHIQYELVHDYLLNEIELNDDMRKVKEADELLEQGLRNWKKFGVVLSRDTLSLIDKQRQQLHLGPEELCLLLVSLAGLREHSRTWHYYLRRAKTDRHGQSISDSLLPYLAHENKQPRDQSHLVLWNFIRHCPAPARPGIILRNVALRTPGYLTQAVRWFSILLVAYAASWFFSRSALEKIGWQALVSLETGCFTQGIPDDLQISVDPSDASNLLVFSRSQPNVCRSTDAGESWESLSRGSYEDIEISSVAIYKDLLILVSPAQIFYWNDQAQAWQGFGVPGRLDQRFHGISIGGEGNQIFVGSSPHEIIAIETTEKCWETIGETGALSDGIKGTCWVPLSTEGTDSISGEIDFLSANEKYIVAGTNEGVWFTSIENIAWQRNAGLGDSVISFAMHSQSLLEDGVFFAVLPGNMVKHGQLSESELSTINVWPFPSTDEVGDWDWPAGTKKVAASQYVYFATTSDALHRYPGWSMFDREWWQIMREQRSTR